MNGGSLVHPFVRVCARLCAFVRVCTRLWAFVRVYARLCAFVLVVLIDACSVAMNWVQLDIEQLTIPEIAQDSNSTVGHLPYRQAMSG